MRERESDRESERERLSDTERKKNRKRYSTVMMGSLVCVCVWLVGGWGSGLAGWRV